MNFNIELPSTHHYVHTKYDILVLSSASERGLLQLGCLQYLHEYNLLDNITKYVSTSAGSVISLLLIVGYSPVEILSYIFNDNVVLESINLKNFIYEFGLKSPEKFFGIIEEMIINKLQYLPSLLELQEIYKKSLYCVTYNLTQNKTEYLSHITYPDMSCIDAVKMSCNIPIIFPRIIYNNCFYIDGAIFDHYALNFACNIADKKDNILGITVETIKTPIHSNSNIFQYLQSIASLAIRKISSTTKNIDNVYTIQINSESDFKRFLNMGKQDAYFIFSCGYDKSKETMKLKKKIVKIEKTKSD